jgi:hypothetical protein
LREVRIEQADSATESPRVSAISISA